MNSYRRQYADKLPQLKKKPEPLRKSGNTAIGKMTLLYQPRIIQATKPKSLNGPFDVFDIPVIRNTIVSHQNNDEKRKMHDLLVCT